MKKNNTLAPLIGNILEYYDFTLYGAFTPIISTYFFSNSNKHTALIIYFLSFLMRPLGAMLFGFIGDKYGRKKAFGIPLILMAIFTFAIALIPPYSSIGTLSSILLILCRLGQGFCLGAEFGGAIVFSLEHNTKNLGFIAGLIGSSVLLGSLLANLVSYILTLSIFPQYFWKISFLIGSLIGIIGIWIRYKSDETPEFDIVLAPVSPLKIVFKDYFYSIIKGASISGLNGLLGSFTFVYLNFYLVKSLNWNINKSLLIISCSHIIAFCIAPISGILSKKFSAFKISSYSIILLLLCLIPCMSLIASNKTLYIIFSFFIFSVFTGIFWGNGNLFLYELFPTTIRYSGVAISDSLGRIIFSAPIPFLCNYMNDSFGYISSSIIPLSFILLIFFLQYLPSQFKKTIIKK